MAAKVFDITYPPGLSLNSIMNVVKSVLISRAVNLRYNLALNPFQVIRMHNSVKRPAGVLHKVIKIFALKNFYELVIGEYNLFALVGFIYKEPARHILQVKYIFYCNALLSKSFKFLILIIIINSKNFFKL